MPHLQKASEGVGRKSRRLVQSFVAQNGLQTKDKRKKSQKGPGFIQRKLSNSQNWSSLINKDLVAIVFRLYILILMNKQKRLAEILLKDQVSETTLDIVLKSMDICYLDGRNDEKKGVRNLDYIQNDQ